MRMVKDDKGFLSFSKVMNSSHTDSFYDQRVCSLGLSVQANHRPNNPVSEAHAEFAVLITTWNYRTQTHFQMNSRISACTSIHIHPAQRQH